MRLEAKKGGHVLSDIKHGGHILVEESPRAAALARTQEGITAAAPEAAAVEFSTPFGYLFREIATDPAAHLPAGSPAETAAVVAGLNALGDRLVEAEVPQGGPGETAAGDSAIPPVYTYWGQFIDHDLTANTDRDSRVSDVTRADLAPLPPAEVVQKLRNLRLPALNLDSVYGDGPALGGHQTEAAAFYDGVKLKVGTAAAVSNNPARPIPGDRIDPVDDLRRDLPRIDKKAQIADGRNDENLVIAQFHTAFLRFHNAVVDRLLADNHHLRHDQAKLFRKARRLTRWHYQWLVVNDYLRTVTLPGVVDKILLGGPKHYKPRDGELYMPLEFSVACYRFGHSMVRAVYDYNRNFGRGKKVLPDAPFNLLFLFTGNAPAPFGGDTDVLPFNWIIEWDRFVDKGSALADRFARRIDSRIAFPLKVLANEGNSDEITEARVKALLKQLARRNLLRGYLLSLPTGQAAAGAMGVEVMTPEDLRQGNDAELNGVIDAHGFAERTPLWYYVLKEAEVRANGTSLGELGSRIVCETMVGLLRNDAGSYLNEGDGWDPSKGVRLPNGDPIVTIGDFLRFAGVMA